MDVETPKIMEQLKEITECCICTEIYNNPKLLPCAHTFCLGCLQQLGRDKKPGDEMTCPVCRKEFTVPSRGINALPSNFFMKNIVEISGNPRSAMTDRDHLKASCDLCAKTHRAGVISARVRCDDCHVNLCDDCAQRHSAGAKGKSHRIAALGSAHRKQVEELLRLKAGVSCVLHPSRKIRMYCLDCRMSICMMCFAEGHRSHRCSNVGNVSKDIRRELLMEIERISVRVSEVKDRLSRLQNEKGVVIRQTKNSENSIARRSAEVKAVVDKHAQNLVEELGQIKARKMKEIDFETEDLQRLIASLAGCQSRIRTIREKSKIGGMDVLREVKDVQAKIDELDATIVTRNYFPVQIAFKANDLEELLKGELTNFVGRTEVSTRACRLLVRLNTNDHRAYGVAAVFNRWYVVCWQTTAIFVFDSQNPFHRLADLHVPRMKSARDIAGCERTRCLYLADHVSSCIWKIALTDPYHTSRWMTGLGEPFTLSVSPKGRVVTLTEGRPHVLEVFAPDAILLRRIHLPDSMDSPQHAIETSRGSFVICHGWASVRLQRVCELARDGIAVTRTYPAGEGVSHVLNRPCHLAIDGDGRVLVADSLNHRVILLDAQLCLDQVLLTRDHDDLCQPSRLCFARSNGHLLVGHKRGVDVFSWTE